MDLAKIVQGINTKLAGEMLTFDMLKPYMDEVIDDINEKLNSTYPVFSDFTNAAYPEIYPNYNFFPDKYIRKAIMYGVAYKFYTTDEEGINSARQYQLDYMDALFKMERDHIAAVPLEYQNTTTGSVIFSEEAINDTPFDFTQLL